MEAWKELTKVPLFTPHEPTSNIWVISGGAGCVNVSGFDPSLKRTVYTVPGGLLPVPEIGNVNSVFEQMNVLPGLFNPTQGCYQQTHSR